MRIPIKFYLLHQPVGFSQLGHDFLTDLQPSQKWPAVESVKVGNNPSPALLFLFMPKKWKKSLRQRWVEAKLLKGKHIFYQNKCLIQIHLKHTHIWFLKVGNSVDEAVNIT